MQRDLFEQQLRAASARAVEFARDFVVETLPDAVRFRVHLNSSHDANAGPGFRLFPEDSREEVSRQTKDLSTEEVLDLLWRDGLVPQWIDIAVVSVTDEVTRLELLVCGRFIGEEKALYYENRGTGPFGIKSPSLPVDHIEGKRFSLHHRTDCWSLAELAWAMRNASKIHFLGLHGPCFDDGVLTALREKVSAVAVEISGAPLRGPGLGWMARLPNLRYLRLELASVPSFSLAALPRTKRLEELSIKGLPGAVEGLDRLASVAPGLTHLSLGGEADIQSAACELPAVTEISLDFPHWPGWVVPGSSLRSLSLCAPAATDDEIARVLDRMPSRLETLSLAGTPVSDEILDSLDRFDRLRYLDLGGSQVSAEALESFARGRPRFRFSPRSRPAGGIGRG